MVLLEDEADLDTLTIKQQHPQPLSGWLPVSNRSASLSPVRCTRKDILPDLPVDLWRAPAVVSITGGVVESALFGDENLEGCEVGNGAGRGVVFEWEDAWFDELDWFLVSKVYTEAGEGGVVVDYSRRRLVGSAGSGTQSHRAGSRRYWRVSVR